MIEQISLRRCLSCGTASDYPSEIIACPLCGGTLKIEEYAVDDNRVELLIPFASAQCPACGMTTSLRRNRQCSGCGAALSEEDQSRKDESVKRRRNTFKVRIERLRKDLEDSPILYPSFTRSGQGISLTDYTSTVFSPSIDEVMVFAAQVRLELRSVTWDPEKDSKCISSFQRIVSALDKGITCVKTLVNQLPPVEVRAVHRALTRCLGQMIDGYVTIIEALIAMDTDEALERQQKGQELFTRGANMLQLLPRIIASASKQRRTPAWWMSGDTFDLAVVAWEGVENTPTTINQAADIVRRTLAMIPGVTDLNNGEALLLLPATVLPVTIADSALLQERASLIHSLLTRTDAATPDWIQDPDELLLRIGEGIHAVNEQVERLGFEATRPYSRRSFIQLLADVYLKLVEGPLRDLGSVAVIAARVERGEPNARYIPEAARGVQAGETVQELERMGPLWDDAVQMLLRNASAHAGVRVLDAGVKMTQRRTESGVVVDEQTVEMSDAEFAEEFARLNEASLALQLSIIPWFFTHQSEHVVRARQAASPTQREFEGLVRLLAGLQGLLHVSVQRVGNTMIVRAETADGIDASSPHILYLVPPIFQSWVDIDSITLNIGLRNPVTYGRAEFPGINPLSGEMDLVAVGLMGRRWLADLSGDAAISADITYIVSPLIQAIGEVCNHASVLPVSVDHIRVARARLVALTNRLRQAQLPPPSTPLVTEVREVAYDAARHLERLYWAYVGSNVHEQQKQVRSYQAFFGRLKDLARRSDEEFARVEGR